MFRNFFLEVAHQNPDPRLFYHLFSGGKKKNGRSTFYGDLHHNSDKCCLEPRHSVEVDKLLNLCENGCCCSNNKDSSHFHLLQLLLPHPFLNDFFSQDPQIQEIVCISSSSCHYWSFFFLSLGLFCFDLERKIIGFCFRDWYSVFPPFWVPERGFPPVLFADIAGNFIIQLTQ